MNRSVLTVPAGGLSVQFIKELADGIVAEVKKVIVGNDDEIYTILYALIADQHVLIESVPGLAKTLLVETLCRTLAGAKSDRIQFTPDLLPQDITGFPMFDEATRSMVIETGPILGDLVEVDGELRGSVNLLLGDEINRTPPKTQSALLSPMQERKVKIAKRLFRLAAPFCVIATQNPIENEGVYPLPEAQLDRFALKIKLDYPSFEDELAISANNSLRKRDAHAAAQPVVDISTLVAARDWIVDNIYLSPALREYALTIVNSTRPTSPLFKKQAKVPEAGQLDTLVKLGMSTRSFNTYLSVMQARAAIEGRDYVSPEDVKALSLPVLRHRVSLTDDAIIDGVPVDEVVKTIVDLVPINDDEELYKRR